MNIFSLRVTFIDKILFEMDGKLERYVSDINSVGI